MRPSIEPDVKGPVRIAGPAQHRRHEAVRLRFSTPAKRLSAALNVENRRLTAGTRTKAAADCSLRAGRERPRPALRVPRREQTAAKTFFVHRKGRRQTPDFQHRPARTEAGLSISFHVESQETAAGGQSQPRQATESVPPPPPLLGVGIPALGPEFCGLTRKRRNDF